MSSNKQKIGTFYGYYTADLEPNKDNHYPNGGRGYICVRIDLPPINEEGGKVKASFSFCSPIDAPKEHQHLNRHFRALARKIANDRMLTKRVKSYIEFDRKKENSLPELFDNALSLIKETKRFDNQKKFMAPEWVRKASEIKKGMCSNSRNAV